jgi:iron complex outermembrane recepter protein
MSYRRAVVLLTTVFVSVLTAGNQQLIAQTAPPAGEGAQTAPAENGAGQPLPPVTVEAPEAEERPRTVAPAPGRTGSGNKRQANRKRQASQAAAARSTTPPPNVNSTMQAPPAYAGGQVATGGQLGMLGNRSVMDTPFSQISYTAKTIADQQARVVTDVLANDPSVRLVWSDQSYGAPIAIRGFIVSPWDFSFNGLYGVVPGFAMSTDSIERIEVLNGPSALLNGQAPLASVGGTVNIVPKRATDDPITRWTTLYASNSQFGTQVDVGRRYGDNKEWGVRFNGTYRDGNPPTENQSQQLGDAALGLDYRGQQLRVSLDIGYQESKVQSPLRPTYLMQGIAVPKAPGADANYFQPWTFAHESDWYGALRGEFDITKDWTVYGAVGGRQDRSYLLTGFATITNANGNLTEAPYNFPVFHDDDAQEVGVRGHFSTGPVDHALAINAGRLDDWSGSQFPVVATIASNLYNPTFIPEPAYRTLSAPLTSEIHLDTVGIADTVSVFNERIQVILGGREQQVASTSYSSTTGMQTAQYQASALTPAVGMIVKPLQNVSLYANYIEGLQPGTTVGVGYANAGQVLAPYVARQIETGVKVDWGVVMTTVALFQITQPSASVDTATNTYTSDALQRNRGIELNAAGQVIDSVRVLGGVSFMQGVLISTPNGTNNGNTAPGVPDVQLNIGGEWDTPYVHGLTLSGRAIYTSAQYYDNANTQEIPSWVRFDVGARYAFLVQRQKVTLRANVINVANASYWASATPTYGLSLGAPRTYLLSATVDF